MSEFVFRESDHTYWLGQERLPGTTSVLGLLGGYEGIPAAILQKAAERGTAVHRVTELSDMGTLDYASLDDELAGYLMGWHKFLDDLRPEIIDMETAGYHPELRYAGTRDRKLILRGQLAILDIKSTYRLMPSTGPQTAAYTAIHNANTPNKSDHVKKRYGLRLTKDGDYQLKEYKDAGDFNLFVSALNCWRWCQRHNQKLLEAIEEYRNV